MWLKLRINQGSLNLPFQHLIAKIKDVVNFLVSLVRFSFVRSHLLREQSKYTPVIVSGVLSLNSNKILP
jgi:hypothetical protein